MKINNLILNKYLNQTIGDLFSVQKISNKLILHSYTTETNTLIKNILDILTDEEEVDTEEKFISFIDFASFVSITEDSEIELIFDETQLILFTKKSEIYLTYILETGLDQKKINLDYEQVESFHISKMLLTDVVNGHIKILKKAPKIYENLIVSVQKTNIKFQSTDIYRVLSNTYQINNIIEKEFTMSKSIVSFFQKNLRHTDC